MTRGLTSAARLALAAAVALPLPARAQSPRRAALPSRAGSAAATAPPDTLRFGSGSSVGFDPAGLRRLDAWVRALVDSGGVPGVQYAVVRDGVIVAHGARGLADVEHRRPMTERSLLWLASLTKPYTAAAVLKLVEEGKVGLDDPVERYLPAYRGLHIRTDAGRVEHRPVTIRQLLTHTSGLGHVPGRGSVMGAGWLDRSIRSFSDTIATQTLLFEPGTRWFYANAGYVTLGRVVEVVTGEPFDRYVREAILKPLGSRDLYWATELRPSLGSRVARVYAASGDGGVAPYFVYDPSFHYVNGAPNGGLFGTALGEARFAQAFLGGGSYGGHRILAPGTVRRMVSDQTPGLDAAWGLGWAAQWPPSRRAAHRARCAFGHTGSAGTQVWVDRDLRLIGVFFLQWSDRDGRLDAYRDRFQRLVYAALTPAARRAARKGAGGC